MVREKLDQSDFDFGVAQRLEVVARDSAIGDGFVDRRDGHDQGKTAAAELGRVANDDGAARGFGHRAIHAGFKLIWRSETIADVEPVNREKKHVGAQLAKRFFRERADERKGIFAKRAAGEYHLGIAAFQLCRDICGVGDDGQAANLAATARDGGGRGARIENDYLAGANHADGSCGDAKLFLFVKPLFFLERLVLQRAGANGERTAMSALEQPLMMERFEILANGDERRVETFREIADEDAAVITEKFQDFAAAFLAKHRKTPRA